MCQMGGGIKWTEENGFIYSLNGKMRDELFDGEISYSLKEAQILIEMWRNHYNVVRPHCSLGYKPQVLITVVIQPSQIK